MCVLTIQLKPLNCLQLDMVCVSLMEMYWSEQHWQLWFIYSFTTRAQGEGLTWWALLVFPSFGCAVLPASRPRQACSNCSSSSLFLLLRSFPPFSLFPAAFSPPRLTDPGLAPAAACRAHISSEVLWEGGGGTFLQRASDRRGCASEGNSSLFLMETRNFKKWLHLEDTCERLASTSLRERRALS